MLAAVAAGCASGDDASPSTSSVTVLPTQSTVTVTASTTTPTRPPIDTTSTTLTGPPHLEVLDPVHGATVTTRHYTFTGFTDPGCTVSVGGQYDAAVQPNGAWALELVLNPGGNTTTLTAADPESGLETAVTTHISYEPPLTLRPDGLGELEFRYTPEEEAVRYLVDVLGHPDADQQRSDDCYERVLTWTWAGLEAWITDDGGHGPAGASYACSRPPSFTNWRVVASEAGLRLQTPEGIGVGGSAREMCDIYGQECTGQWPIVDFDPDFFPYDASRAGIRFEFDRPGEDPTARIVSMEVVHGGGFSGNPGGLSDDYEVAVERLQYRAQLIGTWDGTVTTPWTPPYAITLDLGFDRYAGANHDKVAPAALYFGTDEDCGDSCWTHRRWEVREVVDGVGVGWMAILLEPGPDDVWAEAGLDNIRLSEDGTHLEFDLWRPYELDGEPGPIHFTGTRTNK